MIFVFIDESACNYNAGIRFCIQNNEFCIQNNGFCIENDRFCIKNDGFCMNNAEFWKACAALNQRLGREAIVSRSFWYV